MLKFKISALKLDAIFITHLHGDHYLGLVGLLTSMSMLGRKRKLEIYSPSGLKDLIFNQLNHDKIPMNYEIQFIEIQTESPSIIYTDKNFYIETVPLSHGIPCVGYIFKEKFTSKKLIKERITDIAIEHVIKLKKGLDVYSKEGLLLYKNEDYVLPESSAKSFAYISDTQYFEPIINQIRNINLLYHEATFLEDLKDRAQKTCHSTVIDACTIAQKAQVEKLIIGHFSSRYNDLKPFMQQGKSIFDNLALAEDGLKINL